MLPHVFLDYVKGMIDFSELAKSYVIYYWQYQISYNYILFIYLIYNDLFPLILIKVID